MNVTPLKVLVACEYSGAVRDAFIALGHDAVSCDLLPTDAPGPHHTGDIAELLDQQWDMMIAFPPCTDICVSGAKHFSAKIADGRQQAGIDFFMSLANADIPMIAIENPIGIMSRVWRKPDQIVQPFWFGHEARKPTCLWLKNLPKLTPTNMVAQGEIHITKGGNRIPKWYNLPPGKDRWKIRSTTFQGLANAMASQWSAYALSQRGNSQSATAVENLGAQHTSSTMQTANASGRATPKMTDGNLKRSTESSTACAQRVENSSKVSLTNKQLSIITHPQPQNTMIETAITELTAAINGHAATLQATNALLTSLLSALPGAAQTVVAPAAATEPEAPKPAAPKKAKAAAPTPAPAPEPTPEPEEENDVYKVAASAMFNVPYAEVTNAQRCKARDRMLAMGNNSGDDSAKAEPTPEPTPEPKVEAPAQPAKDPKKEAERLRSEIRSEYSTGCAAGGNQYKEFFRSTLKTHGGVDPSTATGISVQKIPEASLAACLADIKSYSA